MTCWISPYGVDSKSTGSGILAKVGIAFGILLIYQSLLELQPVLEKSVKFQVCFQVPASIVESRMVVGVELLHHFEDKSYTDKVEKAFPETTSGYGTAAKRSAWG